MKRTILSAVIICLGIIAAQAPYCIAANNLAEGATALIYCQLDKSDVSNRPKNTSLYVATGLEMGNGTPFIYGDKSSAYTENAVVDRQILHVDGAVIIALKTTPIFTKSRLDTIKKRVEKEFSECGEVIVTTNVRVYSLIKYGNVHGFESVTKEEILALARRQSA